MKITHWINILQEERSGVIKKNQWVITGYLLFIIPFLLLIVYFFIERDNPIIPRIFGGAILNVILIIVVLSSFIIPAFLFWEALVKVNSIDHLINEILTNKIKNKNEIIEYYKKIINKTNNGNQKKKDEFE